VAEKSGNEKGPQLALIFALPEEARGLFKDGDWQRVASSASIATYLGSVDGVDTVLVVSGMGRANAEAATREVIERYQPEAIISLGFAGGLTTGGSVGDLVVAETLMPIEGTRLTGEPIASSIILVQTSRHALDGRSIPSRAGLCLTTSHIAANPEDKALLGQAIGALAVEMESYWIGQVCRENNVPFLAVRAIIDTVDHQLPKYVVHYAHKMGGQSRWRQVLPVLLRPWWIPGLLRLAAASATARKSLTAFAVAFMGSYTQEAIGHVIVESE
jgi:adenosylhomocysteine nucleosidase